MLQKELPLLDLGYLLGEVVLYSLEVLLGGAHGDFHVNAANLVVAGIGRVTLRVVEDGIGILRTVQKCVIKGFRISMKPDSNHDKNKLIMTSKIPVIHITFIIQSKTNFCTIG